MNGIETATKQMENNLDGNILNGVANNDESDKDDEQIKTLENLLYGLCGRYNSRFLY